MNILQSHYNWHPICKTFSLFYFISIFLKISHTLCFGHILLLSPNFSQIQHKLVSIGLTDKGSVEGRHSWAGVLHRLIIAKQVIYLSVDLQGDKKIMPKYKITDCFLLLEIFIHRHSRTNLHTHTPKYEFGIRRW